MDNRIIGALMAMAASAAGKMSGVLLNKKSMSPLALAIKPIGATGWNGFSGYGRHTSKRFVAQDKRDAVKARNRKRHRAHV